MQFSGRIYAVGIVALFNIMRYFYYHVYFALPFEPNFFILTVVFMSIAWWAGKQYDLAKFYSEKDSLTNTYNRRTMEKRFPDFIKIWHNAAVIMIDLDDFKEINDSFGHQQGDLVLKEVAASLQEIGGKDSMLARWGGDEFVLLIPHKEDIFFTALKEIQSFELESTISAGMSVGFAVYPHDGKTLETLVQKADQAMYKDKQSELDN